MIVNEIDPFYPSSKTCSRCKKVKEDLCLRDRIFKCDHCGFVIDRDLNAAINIKREGASSLAAMMGVRLVEIPASLAVESPSFSSG
mgnify:CR=1 FL=1